MKTPEERFSGYAKSSVASVTKALAVTDDAGLIHLAVSIDKETGFSVLHRPGAMAPPCYVAQCELFDAFDATQDLRDGYVTPARRWPVCATHEAIPTCIRCLGG